MTTKKIILLLTLFLFGFFIQNKSFAQNNSTGIGYNMSFAKVDNLYFTNLIGLKLFWEGKLSPKFSLRTNIDLIMPLDLGEFPVEGSMVYNIASHYFLGAGIGYHWIENLHAHSPKNFSGSFINYNTFAGLKFYNNHVLLEIKYVYLPISLSNEKMYHLHTLRFSCSLVFDF